jgi:hypothetical protein
MYLNMSEKLNKIFVNIEEIIITLLKEGRYSQQLSRSIKILSDETYIPLTQLDYTVESLVAIDDYLDCIAIKASISLEIYLAITIYLSQVIILSCDGIWSVTIKSFLSADEIFKSGETFCSYYLSIVMYNTDRFVRPQYIVMNNMLSKKSTLKGEIFKHIDSVLIDKYKVNQSYLYNCYDLAALDYLIAEGKDFKLEIPSLISKFSSTIDISINKLNRSVNSLKIIDDFIHSKGKLILYNDTGDLDKDTFLYLFVYVGEVIIKAIGGSWKVNPERIITTNYGPQYHWNIRILNSEDRVLKDFAGYMGDNLSISNFTNCQIQKLAKWCIIANRKRDDYAWYDPHQIHKNRSRRSWKMELNDSFAIGLNDEIGNLSDLIIPTLGY